MLLVLSAKTSGALTALAQRWADAFPTAASLHDIAVTAAVGRAPLPCRLALVADEHQTFRTQLARWAECGSAPHAQQALAQPDYRVAWLLGEEEPLPADSLHALATHCPAWARQLQATWQEAIGVAADEQAHTALQVADILASHPDRPLARLVLQVALGRFWRGGTDTGLDPGTRTRRVGRGLSGRRPRRSPKRVRLLQTHAQAHQDLSHAARAVAWQRPQYPISRPLTARGSPTGSPHPITGARLPYRCPHPVRHWTPPWPPPRRPAPTPVCRGERMRRSTRLAAARTGPVAVRAATAGHAVRHRGVVRCLGPVPATVGRPVGARRAARRDRPLVLRSAVCLCPPIRSRPSAIGSRRKNPPPRSNPFLPR